MQTTIQRPNHTPSSATHPRQATASHTMLRHPVLQYHYAALANHVARPNQDPGTAEDLRDLRIILLATLYHLDRVVSQSAGIAALLAPILKPPKM